ncbi:MAG: protocatechuate 3,4-dioxygenase subunit alpha [Bryobacteraceae bacterium]|jgi:protocatechuate 3,4-dioxygenase alpha subunit
MIPTASQTVGPFFNFALTTNRSLGVLAREGAEGERIRLTFRVTDGDGAPTPGDSMIELWQADARGRYTNADPNFCGFGRLETDADGVCVFETVKPGAVDGQAPHINVTVFARGLLKHLYTRLYFEGEPANAHDRVLALVPEERRVTLLAKPAWSFEIRLQGDRETVFFDV